MVVKYKIKFKARYSILWKFDFFKKIFYNSIKLNYNIIKYKKFQINREQYYS